MNFHEFYTKIENRLFDATLSLWATGDKNMQDYFRYLLTQESILSEPVFQNTFPWEEGEINFNDTSEIFNEDFINALDSIKDKDFHFPKERKPYKHQLESWISLLKEKKSIAVTTGTGSGKTECFMLPALYDIYENCRNTTGINAIFLYPLNALIASQRKRMHAWSEALGGISYAVLTGDTDKHKPAYSKQKSSLPELISRPQIRETPPNILFTNPTMLEYLLVRNADVPILEKSQGKLRWILLDEAHTLTGSKAAEMALLIRRVIAAFGVNAKDLRFAITSATVGNKNDDILKNFMAKLCGIDVNQINVISGRRVNHHLKKEDIPVSLNGISRENILKLRENLLSRPGMTLSKIGSSLSISNKEDQLKAIDILADKKVKNNAVNLLPVRAHFFVRGIGGVYTCTNPNCSVHKPHKPEKAIGTMYTVAEKKCSCGYPLLELVSCRSCGNMMIQGEREKDQFGNDKISQQVTVGYEAFQVDQDEEDNEYENENVQRREVVTLIRNKAGVKTKYGLTSFSISSDNTLLPGDDFLMDDEGKCPHCGNANENPNHFRLSSAFMNRILSDIILDQSADTSDITTKTIYNGKKYISFTDSRQGTAKISYYLNLDTERNWLRHQVYHFLIDKLNKNRVDEPLEELERERDRLKNDLEIVLPFRRPNILNDLQRVNSLIENYGNENFNLESSRSSWQEIIDFIKPKSDFKTLLFKVVQGSGYDDSKYAKALLYDQFARRLPRERSLENLGLVNIVYPDLDNLRLPNIAKKLQITLPEWKSLLKISLDYVIRSNFHFQINNDFSFSSRLQSSYLIYPSGSKILNGKNWPSFNQKSIRQSRLVLLICAGMGWHSKEDIDNEKADILNELLEEMWDVLLSLKILTAENQGYQLDFFEKTRFELAGEVYLCPVKNRLLDEVFRGYSPWIKGNLNEQNISYYKIDKSKNFRFPVFPYPHHLDERNKKIDDSLVEKWIKENSQSARDKGLWNDLHERIFDFKKFYLSGEHSAQQSKTRLRELENQFEKGEINILSCSTTMEMGVDIGGISTVVMSNVPPMPANYLQRTGRAGRRKENKSLALTFCAPNPMGMQVMKNPLWALEHPIAPPNLSFDSKQIVERHVNSFLFGRFLRQPENQNKGLRVTENVKKIFYDDSPTIAENFLSWLITLNTNDVREDLSNLTSGTLLSTASVNQLITITERNFRDIRDAVKEMIEDFDKTLVDLKLNAGESSSSYKAVEIRKNQFLKKSILTYLSEEGFLPNAGLPVGIVEFDTLNVSVLKDERRRKNHSNPSYSIVRALTEFAPGNTLVIDGFSYKSSGIIMKNTFGADSERTTIQGCSCGFQRAVPYARKNDRCPKCESKSFSGINLNGHRGSFTELIEPIGFAVDISKPKSRVNIDRTRPQYLQPLLLNIDPWKTEQLTYIDYRSNELQEDAEILFYNTGNGSGYSVCLDCGRVETSTDKLNNHTRLRGGQDERGKSICEAVTAPKENVILGSKFHTNFTEIRLKGSDNKFIKSKKLTYTLGVVFTKALANHLGIEESELGFGTKEYTDYRTIFIYDMARGGAGYASQFGMYLEEIIEKAEADLKCHCEEACTRCLINRDSQWHLEDLNRKLALSWIESIKKNRVPEELKKSKYKVSQVVGSITDEILRLRHHFGIKRINVHIPRDIDNWELEGNRLFRSLINDSIEVNLIVEGEPVYRSEQDKLFLYILSGNYMFKSGKNDTIAEFPIHLSVLLNNDKTFGYISKSIYTTLNFEVEDEPEQFFRVENLNIEEYQPLVLPAFNRGNLFESKIFHIPNGTRSNELVNMVFENFNNKENIKSRIKNKSYKVSYFDKYNQSEFSLRLLLQFVGGFSKNFNAEISSLTVHLEENAFRNNRYPYFITENYKEADDYIFDLEKLAESFDLKVNGIKSNRLPHFRFFEFETDDIKFILRIDAGIAHGLTTVDKINSEDLSYEDEGLEIKKYAFYPLIYNLSIEEK